MCGLVFAISKKKFKKDEIIKTLNLMKNRGPDSQFYHKEIFNFKNLLFLFSRLSIIDLKKRSNQPFRKKNCILIFNGEIYNYLEIKKFLQSKKITFNTNSDTEVLLESYIYWGKSFTKHLRGMWSFILYNKQSKEIVVSRDQFSEKPLFYFKDKKNLVFASETKFILSLIKEKLEKNFDKIRDNIQFGYKSLFKNDNSFHKKIKIFPAGGFLSFKINDFHKLKIRNTKFLVEKKKNFGDLNIRRLIVQSLKIRLRSDVPVAFALSGGVDSNILAGIASKILNFKVSSYSIIDNDPRYDERQNIDYVVKKNGYDHTNINIYKFDHFQELIKITKYFNAPVPTINFLVQNYLMQTLKKDNKKVLISGIGADEIFTGYYHHYNFYFNNHGKKYYDNYELWKKNVSPNIRNNNFLYLKNLKNENFLHSNNKEILYRPYKSYPHRVKKLSNDKLKNRLINELYFETVPIMTYSEDLNSMMYSIENRNPYLDKELVNNVYNQNSKHFIQKGFTKFLLRSAFKDLSISRILNNYRKTGFNYSFRTLFPLIDKKILNFIKKDSLIFKFVKKDNTVDLFKKAKFNDEENKLAFNILTTKIFLDYN